MEELKRRALRGVAAVFMMAMVLGLASTFAWSQENSAREMIAKADRLEDQEKYEESNEVLMEVAEKYPDHPDVYWKIGQNYYNMGERIDIEENKNKKLEMYEKAEAWARKGYDKDPDLADNTFWMAVGISQQAQTKGIAATLLTDRSLAKKIEKYYLESASSKNYHYKEDDSDTISSAHFALGQFYRKIPDSFFVGLLMGTRGDMDKSVKHARTAVEMYPNNLEYTKELGVSLLCRGQREDQPKDIEEGKEYLRKVVEMPAETKLDRIDQQDAKRLLEDPSLACGYSRVQQEEVSEKAFKEE